MGANVAGAFVVELFQEKFLVSNLEIKDRVDHRDNRLWQFHMSDPNLGISRFPHNNSFNMN